MNEYLITVLAEDHRHELLAEARAEALAREATAGRPAWWHRLFRRSAGAPPKRAATSGKHQPALVSGVPRNGIR